MVRVCLVAILLTHAVFSARLDQIMGAATRNRVVVTVVTIETAMRCHVIFFFYLLFLHYLPFQLNAYYDSHCHSQV